MSLRHLRRLLSLALVIFMALGGSILIGVQILSSTACSEKYVAKFIDSKKVDEARRQAFSQGIEALEAKSGIPTRVFDAVYNYSEVTADTAIHRVFSGFDSELYNEAVISRFEGLCKEYLDGTNTKYDEKLVRNTAQEAAKLYSDTFGISNAQELMSFINSVKANYQTLMSFAAILIVTPITLMFLMFQKSSAIFIHVMPGFAASGLTVFLSDLTGIIFKIGQKPKISPEIYANAIASSVRGMFLIAILVGAALFILSLIIHIYLIDKLKNE